MHQMSFSSRAPPDSLGSLSALSDPLTMAGKMCESRKGRERGRKGREKREGEAAHPQKLIRLSQLATRQTIVQLDKEM